MGDGEIDRAAVVAAFATHAGLDLDEDERARLETYVTTVWDMAASLREVPSPGLEGARDDLPLRAAYANRGPDAEPAPAPPPAGEARPERAVAAIGRDARALQSAFANGDFTPLDLTAAYLDRIDRYDPFVRSYVAVDWDGALGTAAALSRELAAGSARSPVHGLPIGAKDSIPIAGMRCTFNSPLMRAWRPRRDAEAVRRLRAAGAVMLGKHNLNEFGWSLPSEDDLTPPPRNPWYPAEFSVGSTSGGGAAVAAGLAAAALGTDGGGSIRLPAGQHGLFGIKPGHGDVPRGGVSDGRVSEVSVLVRSAEDAAAILAVMQTDVDAADAAARLRAYPAERAAFVASPPGAVRLGVPQGYLDDVGMEDDVAVAFDAARRAAEEAGLELVEVPKRALDVLHDAVRANFVVIAAEHYFDHEGPGAHRERYGRSAGFYNLPGSCLTAADYLHALRVGEIARDAIDAVFGTVDLLLTPTTPVVRTSTARDPASHRRGGNARYTSPFNISGHPASSFPAGVGREGIPIGAQLVGPRGSEYVQLRVARALAARLARPPFPDMDQVVGAGA